MPGQTTIRLTQFSHGGGCGCKIAPADLERILASNMGTLPDPRLLVGYGSRDDAAVYDLGDGRAVISTTDFFTPIVDDAFDFGRIAATNAIGDVYAMGGTPLLAVAILGWPLEKLGAELAGRVVDGGRQACHDAGIPLAGGHTIDSPEPFFGLAVTGEVRLEHLKRNDTARAGDVLLLTKPLGIGILATAGKRGKLKPEHRHIARDLMVTPNALGSELGRLEGVHALTDVTGFGLLGHLGEMCAGSNVAATIRLADIPLIPEITAYLEETCYPDATLRNWKSCAPHFDGTANMKIIITLCDPQTSGGLLIACKPGLVDKIVSLSEHFGTQAKPIGELHAGRGDRMIRVQ
ncbi:MAG: selenide, water dikinase SelD [Flavobacteriales bacterium]|nr:selenide, water dikinase SelD [Flavobacteriales bacterium]